MNSLKPLFLLFLIVFLAAPCHAAPPRGFVGVNTATWDSYMDKPNVERLIKAAGITALRFPGGSTSDDFDWTKPQGQTTAQFAHLAGVTGAVATITLNYGSGSPQMAASWVAYCEASPTNKVMIGQDDKGRDWKTAGYWASLRTAAPKPGDPLCAGHPQPFGFHNWEVGNECYGNWEKDLHVKKQAPALYARFAVETAALVHKIDPSARIGAVMSDADWNTSESADDPRAPGVTTSAWNPVVLANLKALHYRPDFIAFHHYAQQPGKESDKALFADAAIWPAMAASLRSLLMTVYGRDSLKIGIACTECNSVAYNPGTQTTGDANAIYYSQVAPIALRLGLENLIWWDLHNNENRSGYDTKSPLNRHPFGDYGILGSADLQDEPYPVYYAIQKFAVAAPIKNATHAQSARKSQAPDSSLHG